MIKILQKTFYTIKNLQKNYIGYFFAFVYALEIRTMYNIKNINKKVTKKGIFLLRRALNWDLPNFGKNIFFDTFYIFCFHIY
jgi:hypothetical protein